MAQYLKTVELGLQVALRNKPQTGVTAKVTGEGRTGVVLVGSEIGLCGAFNERLVDFKLQRLADAGIAQQDCLILTIGTRANSGWRVRAEAPDHLEEAPATVEALSRTVAAALTRLDLWRESDGVSRLVLFHQRPGAQGRAEPGKVAAFPLDPGWLATLRARDGPSRRLPFCAGPPDEVFRHLIRQLLFARVFTAIIQSRAAGHAERLVAMQAADRSIAEKMDDLRTHHRPRRQEVITSELLDIIVGYEATADDAG